MYVETLQASNWRSFFRFEVELSQGLNFVIGDNAQGKTNLLEAVYFLAHLSSFRTRRSQELVTQGRDSLAVAARVVGAAATKNLRVELASGRRKLFVDGLPTSELDSFLDVLKVLLFSPGQVEMLRGSPDSRRRFLDRGVMRGRPMHATNLRLYQRLLRTRNKCLKNTDWSLADVYLPKILDVGARIVAARLALVFDLAALLEDVYEESVGVAEQVSLSYRSSWLRWRPDSSQPFDFDFGVTKVREEFAQAQERTAGQERDRGQQVVGPQGDDLEMTIQRLSAPRHASQGQMRSLLASLVLSEYRLLEKSGYAPVLLVDDFSSELDEHRRQAMIEYMRSVPGQVLVTGTDLAGLGSLGAGNILFVEKGTVHQKAHHILSEKPTATDRSATPLQRPAKKASKRRSNSKSN